MKEYEVLNKYLFTADIHDWSSWGRVLNTYLTVTA